MHAHDTPGMASSTVSQRDLILRAAVLWPAAAQPPADSKAGHDEHDTESSLPLRPLRVCVCVCRTWEGAQGHLAALLLAQEGRGHVILGTLFLLAWL